MWSRFAWFSQIWGEGDDYESASELVAEERYDGENERDERDREELDDEETYFRGGTDFVDMFRWFFVSFPF